MSSGMRVLRQEGKTSDELIAKVRGEKRKYQFEMLQAKEVSETESKQTWSLTGRLGKHKRTQKLTRPKTLATQESHVSDKDRKLHKQILNKIESKLKALSSEKTESFADFYNQVKSKAQQLESQYKLELREGIKIDVDLMNSIQEDKKDGDVDVQVKIAPNAKSKVLGIAHKDAISKFKWGGLGKDENDFRQSHTIKTHVNITDSGLKQRIRRDGVMVASRFINYGVANSAVSHIIDRKANVIADWYNNSQRGLLTLKKNTGHVGHYYTIEQLRVPVQASKTKVVLNPNNNPKRPFFVLTAFPYERKVEEKLSEKYK